MTPTTWMKGPTATSKFERQTYEYMTELLDIEDLFPTDEPCSSQDDEDCQLLLTRFHKKLPRELRELVYSHLIGSQLGLHTYLPTPFHNTFVIQEPDLLFHFNYFKPITLFNFLPSHLLVLQSTSQDSNLIALAKSTLLELAAHFFASNTFYIRYRYTRHLIAFLTRPFKSTQCIPIQHLRKLNIILSAPESAEDGYPIDYESDLEAEFAWKQLFPLGQPPLNEKCAMYREMLEGDFEWLARELETQGAGRCELGLFVSDVRYEGQEGKMVPNELGLVKWLGEWVDGVERGGVTVRWLVP